MWNIEKWEWDWDKATGVLYFQNHEGGPGDEASTHTEDWTQIIQK